MRTIPLVLRPAAGLSGLAAVVSTAAVAHLVVWSDEAAGLVGLVAVLATTLHIVGLGVGLRSAIGGAAVMSLVASIIAIAAAEEPAWFEATVASVAIYGAAELGWEAVDRRNGSRRTPGAWRLWFEERAIVVLLVVLVAAAAGGAAGTAPVRSILVQAAISVGFVAGVLASMRRLTATPPVHTDN